MHAKWLEGVLILQ